MSYTSSTNSRTVILFPWVVVVFDLYSILDGDVDTMNIMCIWRGHKWETVDEIDIPPVAGLEHIRGIDKQTLIKIVNGYKRIHQECGVCGDRRVLHEF